MQPSVPSRRCVQGPAAGVRGWRGPEGQHQAARLLFVVVVGGTSREEQTGPGPRTNAPVLRPLTRVCACGCAVEAAGSRYWPVKHSQVACRLPSLAVELAEH